MFQRSWRKTEYADGFVSSTIVDLLLLSLHIDSFTLF
jgi:hypothetical protein